MSDDLNDVTASGNAVDNAVNGAGAIVPSLPANPSSLVFHGTTKRFPGFVEYVSLEELEGKDVINTTFKVFIGIVVRYKKAKVGNDGRSIYSRLSQEKR